MERLTVKGFNYSDAGVVENMRMATVSAAMCRLAAYEDTGLEPDEITDFLSTLKEWRQNMGALRHVHELVTAEAEGRLLVLPCKVGDIVFYIRGQHIIGDTVQRIVLDEISGQVIVDANHCYLFSDVGKTVFRTREEAEAKLKECEGT